MLIRALACVLVLLPAPAAAQLHLDIVDLCTSPDKVSAGTGNWNTAGTWTPSGVPSAGQKVHIASGHTVTVDMSSTTVHECVGVLSGGILKHAENANTKLTVEDFFVYAGGEYRMGTEGSPINDANTADLVIAANGTYLDVGTVGSPGADVAQRGGGLVVLGTWRAHGAIKTPFCRVAEEISAAETVIDLACSPTNWDSTDQLVIPDTDDIAEAASWTPPGKIELVTGTVSGSTLTLSSGAANAHGGPHDTDGTLVTAKLFHIINLTRNVRISALDPSTNPAHVMVTHQANVDIRYVQFIEMGRTTTAALNCTLYTTGASNCGSAGTGALTAIGTNQIGNYPLHFHHLSGPTSGGACTVDSVQYQFCAIGNSIDGGDEYTHRKKWGIAVHNSHWGLVKDNVFFNTAGAALANENGSEKENVETGNGSILVRFDDTGGAGGRGDERAAIVDLGFEGTGFWSRGPSNHVTNNWSANAVGYGFKFFMILDVSTLVQQPNFAGAHDPGDFTQVNIQARAITEYDGNEAYGPPGNGMTIWNLCNDGDGGSSCAGGPNGDGRTYVDDFSGWHLQLIGFYGYPIKNVTFRNWWLRGDEALLTNTNNHFFMGIWFGDYHAEGVIIENADIRNVGVCIQSPPHATGELLLRNSYLQCVYNVRVDTPGAPGSNPSGANMQARSFVMRNVTHEHIDGGVGGATQQDVWMRWQNHSGSANYAVADDVYSYDHDGDTSKDYRLYYTEAAAAASLPETTGNQVGCPTSGKTNAQCWATHGVAWAGSLPICETDTANIADGFACAVSDTGGGPRRLRLRPVSVRDGLDVDRWGGSQMLSLITGAQEFLAPRAAAVAAWSPLVRSNAGMVRQNAVRWQGPHGLTSLPQAQIMERAVTFANGAALVAHGADFATTQFCTQARTCQERNPIIAPWVSGNDPDYVKFFAYKWSIALASYWGKNTLKQSHPKWALVAGIAETAAFSFVAWHNHRIHEKAIGQR